MPQPQDEHQHCDTPEEAIVRALAHCQTEDFKEVLIIYNTKDGKSGSFDSNLNTAEAGFLCFMFLAWMTNCNLGVLQGGKADAIAKAVLEPEEDAR